MDSEIKILHCRFHYSRQHEQGLQQSPKSILQIMHRDFTAATRIGYRVVDTTSCDQDPALLFSLQICGILHPGYPDPAVVPQMIYYRSRDSERHML